jgi:glucose-6-phosphate-specific signal transduction histidine kinase
VRVVLRDLDKTLTNENAHALGVGGAVVGAGSGLRGLADRVAALDGRLELDSPAGHGTRLRAELPCG